MSKPLSGSAQKVQDILRELGLTNEVVELPQSTHTALEAAEAIGCTVEQIVKSLIFKGKQSQRPVLVVASGPNRVNEKKIGSYLGEPIERADADFVRKQTGFVIGGVPPLGHTNRPETFVDEDLMQYPEIWAAAGTPNAVFGLTPQELVKITGGQVVTVK
ncbi:MAG TPA: YbaK/EbsC family protein [Chloroflexia bacterium]|nr:YbaK/EbsC family protein [Chloroflexia bacterium]